MVLKLAEFFIKSPVLREIAAFLRLRTQFVSGASRSERTMGFGFACAGIVVRWWNGIVSALIFFAYSVQISSFPFLISPDFLPTIAEVLCRSPHLSRFSGLSGRFGHPRTFRRQVACEERGKFRLKFNEHDRDAFTCAASENDIFRMSGFFWLAEEQNDSGRRWL